MKVDFTPNDATNLASTSLGWWKRLWRVIKQLFVRCFTGKSTLEHIVESSTHSVAMTIAFRTEIYLTTDYFTIRDILCDPKQFQTLEIIQMMKQLHSFTTIGVANVTSCLKQCNYANGLIEQLVRLQQESFDSSNEKHEELLELLWTSLKPEIRRDGRITKQWEEIGFQGEDPATDFRSMGILGLRQLIYFATTYPVEAKKVLEESNHPTRWFPFAITGINITSMIMDCNQERILDHLLYRHANDELEFDAGINELNEFYCRVFTVFNDEWVRTNPTSVMEFPIVFKRISNNFRNNALQKSFSC